MPDEAGEDGLRVAPALAVERDPLSYAEVITKTTHARCLPNFGPSFTVAAEQAARSGSESGCGAMFNIRSRAWNRPDTLSGYTHESRRCQSFVRPPSLPTLDALGGSLAWWRNAMEVSEPPDHEEGSSELVAHSTAQQCLVLSQKASQYLR
ncbi:hypothetical protein [Streptomyces sp. NPDC051677]|uniref:hypothetical protein n=1 Tax=Streptomyces sp. NPDC051677 TaxID=3365669 RepID=UPI0037CEFE92